MKKAIIFDLDGVISNTDKTRFILLKKILEKRSIVLNDYDYKKSIGKRTKIFLKETFAGRLADSDIRQIYEKRKLEYHKNPEKYIQPMPYAYECCKKLFDSKLTLAIASASEEKDIMLVLTKLNLLNFFKVIIGSDKIKKPKPDPEVYLQCLKKLSLLNDECLAVEDSPLGIKSAKAAGIKCIAVGYTHKKHELEEADRFIDTLKELTPEVIAEI